MLYVGLLIAVVGWIALLIIAFQENPLWGIGVMIVPFVGLIFTLAHWREAKIAFLMQVVGGIIYGTCGGFEALLHS